MKSKIVFVLICAAVSLNVNAEAPASLDKLLEQIRQDRLLEKKENVERVAKFREAHDQQQQLLAEAKAELAAEEARGNNLKATYENNEREISTRDALLNERMGALSEMESIVRQIANDIDAIVDRSLISAQKPGRDDLVDKLAQGESLPSITELEDLWHLVLDEMVESGKVVRFPANIITSDGREVEQEVIRVGAFNAISNGQFLRYLPETGQLAEPGRQPSRDYQNMAAELESATDGIIAFPIDPTRGVLLGLLIQSPDLIERIAQAEEIGYVILGLGAIALIIIIERFITLFRTRRRVLRQQEQETISLDNPLGKLRQVERDSPRADAETLGLKLDQAILKEIPLLRKRLSMLAVFATAAPLLGLLGTVAGMIETFQSMTVFGAGDPKVVSSGISLALIATELGLVVAIPILLLHGWLHDVCNQIIHIMEEEVAALVARREEMIHGNTAKHS